LNFIYLILFIYFLKNRYHLGVVFDQTDRCEKASHYFMVAFELENTSPIRSYNVFDKKLPQQVKNYF